MLFTGAGVFLLASAESEQISFLFDCIVRGISPTRGPFGLRPLLPGQYQRCLMLLGFKAGTASRPAAVRIDLFNFKVVYSDCIATFLGEERNALDSLFWLPPCLKISSLKVTVYFHDRVDTEYEQTPESTLAIVTVVNSPAAPLRMHHRCEVLCLPGIQTFLTAWVRHWL